MDKLKKQRLISQGWKVSKIEYILELRPEEVALIEIRLSSLGRGKGKFVVPDDFNVLSEEILLTFESDR